MDPIIETGNLSVEVESTLTILPNCTPFAVSIVNTETAKAQYTGMAKGEQPIKVVLPKGEYEFTITYPPNCPDCKVGTDWYIGPEANAEPVTIVASCDDDTQVAVKDCNSDDILAELVKHSTLLETINTTIKDESDETQAKLDQVVAGVDKLDTSIKTLETTLVAESDETQQLITDKTAELKVSLDAIKAAIEQGTTDVLASLDNLKIKVDAALTLLGEIKALAEADGVEQLDQGITLDAMLTALNELKDTLSNLGIDCANALSVALCNTTDITDPINTKVDEIKRPVAVGQYCDENGETAYGYWPTNHDGSAGAFVLVAGSSDFDPAKIVPCTGSCQYMEDWTCFEMPDGKVVKVFEQRGIEPCSGDTLFHKGTVVSRDPCATVNMDQEITDFTGWKRLECCPDGLSDEPSANTTTTLRVDASSGERIYFKAGRASGGDMNITWPDGNTAVWSGGTVENIFSTAINGEVVFSWDPCDPPVMTDPFFFGSWADDIANINNLPSYSGDLVFHDRADMVGNSETLATLPTGVYEQRSPGVAGDVSRIAATATHMDIRSQETLDASQIGSQLQYLETWGGATPQASTYGNLDDGDTDGLKAIYLSSRNNGGLTTTTAGFPINVTESVYFGNGGSGDNPPTLPIMTGLFEEIQAELGSEPSTIPWSDGRHYTIWNTRVDDTGAGVGGSWDNKDLSSGTAHFYRLQMSNGFAPGGDIKNLFPNAKIDYLQLTGYANGTYQKIDGDFGDVTWTNDRDALGRAQFMDLFVYSAGNLVTDLETAPTLTPGTTGSWRINGTLPGSLASGTGHVKHFSEHAKNRIYFVNKAENGNEIYGDMGEMVAFPVAELTFNTTNPANPLTGDASAQMAAVTTDRGLFRIYGEGNQATVNLDNVPPKLLYLEFYGDKVSQATGGYATMSTVVPLTRCTRVQVEMYDQTSIDNLLQSVVDGGVSNGYYYQYGSPINNPVLVTALKGRGWRVYDNGVLV